MATYFYHYQGSISPTSLRKAFTLADPKSPKRHSSQQLMCVLLGSASVKAVHKTLVKSTPSVSYFPYFLQLTFK